MVCHGDVELKVWQVETLPTMSEECGPGLLRAFSTEGQHDRRFARTQIGFEAALLAEGDNQTAEANSLVDESSRVWVGQRPCIVIGPSGV